MGKLVDLTGQQIGEWKVLYRDETNSSKNLRWFCECSCGVIKSIIGGSLKGGKSQSCGKHNFENLVGKEFNRLTVLEYVGKKSVGKVFIPYWFCSCLCGTKLIVNGNRLKGKVTQSCGCLSKEVLSARNKEKPPHITHGLSKTPQYKRAYDHKYREIKRLYDSYWTPEMQTILHETQPVCVICNTNENLTTDHVIPLSKGGGLKPGNAVVLCRSHNSRKNKKDLKDLPVEWQEKILIAVKEFAQTWLRHLMTRPLTKEEVIEELHLSVLYNDISEQMFEELTGTVYEKPQKLVLWDMLAIAFIKN